MGKFLLGLFIGLIILPLGVLIYVDSGQIPVGATEAPMPFEKYLAGHAVHARIDKLAPQRDIADFKTSDIVAGAMVYQQNCAYCHGLPNQPAPPPADGMFPQAPQLFTPDGTVTDDPVGVTYWKVKNGIRLSGMPSFAKALSDQQMWDVSSVAALANTLPPSALDALKPAAAAVPAANATRSRVAK